MKIFWKCLRESICGHKIVSAFLFVTVILSVWTIVAVQLVECMKCPSVFTQEECDKLNPVLINLAYSFLAAYFFYMITIWLPSIIRAYKMHDVIVAGMKNIKVCIHNMYSMFHDVGNDGNIDMNDIDTICERMKQCDWMETLFAPLSGKNLIQHLAYFSKCLDNNIVEFMTIYKENLSADDLKGLSEIMENNEVTLFEVLSNTVITKDNCRVPINSFRKLLEVSKLYFKDLNP